jgi:hypothetical protein
MFSYSASPEVLLEFIREVIEDMEDIEVKSRDCEDLPENWTDLVLQEKSLKKNLTGKICEKSLPFLQYSSANPAE